MIGKHSTLGAHVASAANMATALTQAIRRLARRLEVRDRGQGARPRQRARPGVQQNALLDRPDDRRIGAFKFHVS
jgi:hypothetical protein